jgi:PncC family amidohydrolase
MPQFFAALIHRVAEEIKVSKATVVFAESCTAGLISASLARTPGISEFLCGSAVVYQEATKIAWLDVSASLLASDGAVSESVAKAMAIGVLERTPLAQVSVSITGHLGPGAPPEQDGLVYIGLAKRSAQGYEVAVFRHVLAAQITEPFLEGVTTLREWRQWKAVELVLNHLLQTLSHSDPR